MNKGLFIHILVTMAVIAGCGTKSDAVYNTQSAYHAYIFKQASDCLDSMDKYKGLPDMYNFYRGKVNAYHDMLHRITDDIVLNTDQEIQFDVMNPAAQRPGSSQYFSYNVIIDCGDSVCLNPPAKK